MIRKLNSTHSGYGKNNTRKLFASANAVTTAEEREEDKKEDHQAICHSSRILCFKVKYIKVMQGVCVKTLVNISGPGFS